MKSKFKYEKVNWKLFKALIVFLLVFYWNTQIINASTMNSNINNDFIIEELRLKVPAKYKKVWLNAEEDVWEPWLSNQNGFLGRQIFWNKEKEEALILVSWKNKNLWKNIPLEEVNKIQNKFEDKVKQALNEDLNPFNLIYEGELDKHR